MATRSVVTSSHQLGQFFGKLTHSEGSELQLHKTLENKQSYRTFEEMGNENPELEGRVTVEDVLEKLGGYSRFQLYVTFIVLTAEIPAATIALNMVFTGTNNVDFKCMRNDSTFDMISAQDPKICIRNCTLGLDTTKPIVSIVQEWELICERAWLPDFFTSIQMMGMMTGAMSGSQLADGYGRKKILYGTIALMGIFGFVSGIVGNMYLFGISRFLAGIGLGGFYVVYYIFLMEFLTPKWRTISGCVSIWSAGIMVLALLAYLISPWRYLTCVSAIPALFLLCFYPFVPETPRWLLCKERTAEAERSLNLIARMNGKPTIEPSVVESLQKSVLLERSDQSSPSVSSLEIFQNPELRSKAFVFLFGWYAAATVYYSMSFNTKNVSGDPYMNVFYMGLVDLPAFPSGVLFNNWLGRRKTYGGYFIFASIFLVALVIVDVALGTVGHEQLISILSYLGRFGVCGAWGVIACFTAESFPTTCRTTAMGLCAFAANIGGVIAPQLAYLGSISPSTPYFVFAGLSLVAASSTLLLSETNKKPLANFAK